jgi:cytochrome c oxidase subunit III
MACLIIAESSIFTIFVVAYLYYTGQSLTGPTPREVLHAPIFYTVCLLSSSLTVHFAARFLHFGRRGAFLALWLLTILLGGVFLYGTGREWHRLIYEHGLTISTNLFGTTYYSLVGLHATHVIAGLIMLSIVFFFALGGYIGGEHSARVKTLSLYWHFVDAVWVVVFTVVYILGR